MHIIELDATGWKNTEDFYAAIIAALGAPVWHGHNANALLETMIWYDDINIVAPPYRVVIRNAFGVPKVIREEIELVQKAIRESRARLNQKRSPDVDVDLELA